ncbi:MAG: hypothetical protein FJ363_03140 [Gemmatimonadetes bacterium]|nr:hypothetical protein [Gemmatimonadota bacterium]
MQRQLFLLTFAVSPLLAQQQAAPPAAPAAPLAQYTSVRVAVAPVQFFRADSGTVSLPAMAVRAAFDSLVAVQLEEHGLLGTWATPAEVVRTARRNAMYTSDPHNLGAFPVRNGVAKDGVIADPLAGNLRRLVALHDARYVLLPVELRVLRGAVETQATVRVIFVDARLMKALFQVDLAGDPAPAYSTDVLNRLAARVVELAVAP